VTRGIVHRLRRLEERSAAAGDSYFHPHLIRFITPYGEVASILRMEFGKPRVWTHLRPAAPSFTADAQHE
jgi:hypothetical protein